MSNDEFLDALWFRFSLPAPFGLQGCHPHPSEDPLGLHRLGCRNSAYARRRLHDEMVSVIASTALAADPRSL